MVGPVFMIQSVHCVLLDSVANVTYIVDFVSISLTGYR